MVLGLPGLKRGSRGLCRQREHRERDLGSLAPDTSGRMVSMSRDSSIWLFVT